MISYCFDKSYFIIYNKMSDDETIVGDNVYEIDEFEDDQSVILHNLDKKEILKHFFHEDQWDKVSHFLLSN
jgi:hypothetical protein